MEAFLAKQISARHRAEMPQQNASLPIRLVEVAIERMAERVVGDGSDGDVHRHRSGGSDGDDVFRLPDDDPDDDSFSSADTDGEEEEKSSGDDEKGFGADIDDIFKTLQREDFLMDPAVAC